MILGAARNAHPVIGLLVPTDVLTTGEYRIEVRRGEDRTPFFTSRFRVATPMG